jgi:hypothetical protein
MGDAKTPDAMVKARLDAAKTLLTQHGYVVLKAKSYRAAQQRQHIAEAIAKYADDQQESTRRWAQTTLHNEIRELMARCTFLYGTARAHGATVEELRGGWATTGIGINCPTCGGD